MKPPKTKTITIRVPLKIEFRPDEISVDELIEKLWQWEFRDERMTCQVFAFDYSILHAPFLKRDLAKQIKEAVDG